MYYQFLQSYRNHNQQQQPPSEIHSKLNASCAHYITEDHINHSHKQVTTVRALGNSKTFSRRRRTLSANISHHRLIHGITTSHYE
jgi:hypothetical protein